MAIVYDRNVGPVRLGIDVTGETYTVQAGGVNATFPAQPANTRIVRLAAGGVNYDVDAAEFGRVAFAAVGLNKETDAGTLAALGRLAAQAIAGGSSQSSVLGVFARP